MFRVQGLVFVFRVEGLGSSGFGVERVQGSGFRV